MPFCSYTWLSDVARPYQITLQEEEFVKPLPIAVSESLRSDLEFARIHVSPSRSEAAVCEIWVYPILREVWKHHTDALTLWCHELLHYDQDLTGTPDYFVAKKSPLGHWVLDQPYLLVMEAKRDDFTKGWGQCLAAMLAAQKLNNLPEQTLYGITTNGRVWEFGKLQGSTFSRNAVEYLLHDLDTLCAAVNFAFEQCRQQLATLLRSA